MKKETWYSTNEEDFFHTDIYYAIDLVFDDVKVKIGDVRTVYSGEVVKLPASSYLRNIVEHIQENAYAEHGEIVDNWPNISDDQANEIESIIDKVVDKWFTKNKVQPTFGSVEKVKSIDVKLISLDENGCAEYEFK